MTEPTKETKVTGKKPGHPKTTPMRKQPAPTLMMQIRKQPLAKVRWQYRIILDVSGNRQVLESGTTWGQKHARTKVHKRARFFQASLTQGWQGVEPRPAL